ncbi:MAG: 4Fe-4S dicluster domain-containing protein [Chloroflexi bacterium]|nr:4Fe-4S dicluster domain-containing protein [Chloroflexota bacterium]
MPKEGFFRSLFKADGQNDAPASSQQDLAQMGCVVPDASRCVQCGVCGYNCPVGIRVRDYAHRGLPVDDPRCITCGNCIQVCPRGTLRWETQAHVLVKGRFLLTAVNENV